MSVKDTVQQFAVNQALKYIEGNPDENIPKLMALADKLLPEGWGKYSVSADGVVAACENPMVPVFRLSEICYTLAEIAADEGKISEGIEYLSAVRKARGALRDIALSVTTAEQLKEEILLDARKDLMCEGQIFFMYKRLNREQVPSASRPGFYKNMREGYVLPIPTSESPF